jgi:hypothetical protein
MSDGIGETGRPMLASLFDFPNRRTNLCFSWRERRDNSRRRSPLEGIAPENGGAKEPFGSKVVRSIAGRWGGRCREDRDQGLGEIISSSARDDTG